MAKSSFVLGKGTIVEIALLPIGDATEPVRAVLATTNAITAKDIASPAEITLSAALGAGVKIPAGSFLGFVAPTSGKSVLVQLIADALAGDTTLAVATIPEAIAASSVAKYPLRLSGRTAANIGRKANRTAVVDFESDGYSTGLTTRLEQTLDCPGNWLPTDAGFATAEYAITELRPIFLWVTLPKISDAYSKGRIYSGVASIIDLPLDVPADGVISGKASLNFEGKPAYTPDAPVP